MLQTDPPAHPIVKEILLDAPIDDVWAAISVKEEMRKWYFDLEHFEPEKGFEFEFWGEKDGEKFLHLCEITEANPPRKLSYSWRYENWPGESLLCFELFTQDNGTLLRLTHSGLESFPQNDLLRRQNFEEGWTSIIDGSLAKHFENKEKIEVD